MQILRPFVCGILACLACGCANHAVRPPALTQPPLVVSDKVRESLPNDYLRVSFLSAGLKVTSLSRPGALRAFATAAPLYDPPLRLKDLPDYSGLVNDDTRVLVAMRCRPPQPDKVDAVLATWPNVFLAIQRDVLIDAAACAAPSDNTATMMACYAKAFTDPPATAVPLSLAHTFSYAGALYDDKHAAMAKWLQDNYGIFPAFAGSGYSIKDSYSLSSEPMTSQQILVKSISSEYILKNVSLSDAGCRCISVAPYTGRSNDPLDPDFVAKAGGDGACTPVEKLAVSPR
jgi:hypothetical protein